MTWLNGRLIAENENGKGSRVKVLPLYMRNYKNMNEFTNLFSIASKESSSNTFQQLTAMLKCMLCFFYCLQLSQKLKVFNYIETYSSILGAANFYCLA